ncbi:hypothetical protein RFI_03898, partial [Reticulomyxa filosa]
NNNNNNNNNNSNSNNNSNDNNNNNNNQQNKVMVAESTHRKREGFKKICTLHIYVKTYVLSKLDMTIKIVNITNWLSKQFCEGNQQQQQQQQQQQCKVCQLMKEWEKYHKEKDTLEKEKREMKALSRELSRKNRLLEMKQSKVKLVQQLNTLGQNELLLNAFSAELGSSTKDSNVKPGQHRKFLTHFQSLHIGSIRDSIQTTASNLNHSNLNAAPPSPHDPTRQSNPNQKQLHFQPFQKLKVAENQKKLEEIEGRVIALLEGQGNWKHKAGKNKKNDNDATNEVNQNLEAKTEETPTQKKWVSKSARQSPRNSKLLKQKRSGVNDNTNNSDNNHNNNNDSNNSNDTTAITKPGNSAYAPFRPKNRQSQPQSHMPHKDEDQKYSGDNMTGLLTQIKK